MAFLKNKIKENIIYRPSIDEVEKYFVDNGYTYAGARSAWNYYEAGNWCDSKGNKVKNWKQKMRGVWFRDEFKINKQTVTNFTLPIN